MEFIEGTRLKGPHPAEKAVEYARQILDALDAAHKKGFTHRDLKPANIMVTRQGVKLLDFLGTLQYMSREQLQGNEVDARSDLFSFGCVLYEMLSGKRAFEGSSQASVIAAIMEREPTPVNVGPPLQRVIGSCLAMDPNQRFQTAFDLKRALDWALAATRRHSADQAMVLDCGAGVGHICPPEGGNFNLVIFTLHPMAALWPLRRSSKARADSGSGHLTARSRGSCQALSAGTLWPTNPC